jgi:hypothetical protein
LYSLSLLMPRMTSIRRFKTPGSLGPARNLRMSMRMTCRHHKHIPVIFYLFIYFWS